MLRPSPLRRILPLLSLALGGVAVAGGYSTDVELLRPGLSSSGLPGVDSPRVARPGAAYGAVFAQYEREPLLLYEFGNEVGPIIEQRLVSHLGGLWTPRDNLKVRAVLPLYSQSGGDVPELRVDGAGLGDLGVAAVFQAVELGPVAVGPRIDITLPTGRAQAYMGEDSVRTGAAVLAHAVLGRLDLLLDAGATLRTAVTTEEDWELGSELGLSGGLRYPVLPDRLSVYALTLNRTALQRPWSGGANSPAESVLGVQGFVVPAVRLDLGLGKGWTAGYGTTQQRLLLGVTVQVPQRKPDTPTVRVVALPDDAPPPPPPEQPEVIDVVVPWAEGELARVQGGKIQIRDPLQFEFNTDHILPESIPTLRYVASLLAGNDRIGHVVIEGHASEEGSFAYNYDLSIRRARAVWEQLLMAGTHPNRMSYRGMGEVVPHAAGEDEASLARNRRVEFHIVYQLDPLTPPPHDPALALLPWNGAPNDSGHAVAPPPAPRGDASVGRLDESVFAPDADDDAEGLDAPDTPPDAPPSDDDQDDDQDGPSPTEASP